MRVVSVSPNLFTQTDRHCVTPGNAHPVDVHHCRMEQTHGLYVACHINSFNHSFPDSILPPSVRQSPAPNILPCVYVADGKGDAWIDFLLIAIFDCCKSMVPSDVTFSISDYAGIVVLTFYKYFTQCELTSNTKSCFIANIVEGRAGISGARLLSTIYRDGTSSNDGLYSFCFS